MKTTTPMFLGLIVLATPAAALADAMDSMPGMARPTSAMTMTFKANPPTLLHGLKVGQSVGFDVKMQGGTTDVTAVRPN